MASTKEEFIDIIKQIREVVASDECSVCSCPNIRCELHGDCYNCVRVYRHFGHHVPRCLQFVLDKKMAGMSQTMQNELGKRPKTPDEFYDYLNTVMPKTGV
ncbi:MAG TPA: hypothetical protein VMU29_13750 [Smithella sp.]|nr:hypothetical protein [Smithella sp.]